MRTNVKMDFSKVFRNGTHIMGFLVMAGLLLSVLFHTACAKDMSGDIPAVSLIPWPKDLTMSSGSLALTSDSRIVYTSKELQPLAEVLSQELFQIMSMKCAVTDSKAKAGDIVLKIDPSLSGETHTLTVDDQIVICANNYKNTAMASVSLLQAIEMKGAGALAL